MFMSRTEAFERVLPLIPEWVEGFNIPQKEALEIARETVLHVARTCSDEILDSYKRFENYRFENYAYSAVDKALFRENKTREKKKREGRKTLSIRRCEFPILPLSMNTYFLTGISLDSLLGIKREDEFSTLYWG